MMVRSEERVRDPETKFAFNRKPGIRQRKSRYRRRSKAKKNQHSNKLGLKRLRLFGYSVGRRVGGGGAQTTKQVQLIHARSRQA